MALSLRARPSAHPQEWQNATRGGSVTRLPCAERRVIASQFVQGWDGFALGEASPSVADVLTPGVVVTLMFAAFGAAFSLGSLLGLL